MAHGPRYTALVGRRVEARYRASDLQLSAVGTLMADDGKSIFIEEQFLQSGKKKTLRVEIPYGYIVRVVESNDDQPSSSSASK